MPTSITSKITNGQKKQIKRFVEDALERIFTNGAVDKDDAQKIISNGGELQTRIEEVIQELSMPDQFADEEVKTAHSYPNEYEGPRPIEDQIKVIAEAFDLDPTETLECAKRLPTLPKGAEGWFAIPNVDAVYAKHFTGFTDPAEKYCCVLRMIHEKLASRRKFSDNDIEIDVTHIMVSLRTQRMMQKITKTQKGDILIIAAQLGKRHAGRSVRRAREVFAPNEFGLTGVAVGSIILSHPERLSALKELEMDCAGDKFSDDGDGQFDLAPYWSFRTWADFDVDHISNASGCCGSASGFVSQ